MRYKHGEKNTFENQKVNLTKIVIVFMIEGPKQLDMIQIFLNEDVK